MTHVAIIGAGMAGIAAAHALTQCGAQTTVFDRGGVPGGRCSSRMTPDGRFDHGAQYFTVRDPSFKRVVDDLERAGVVAAWTGRVVDLKDGIVSDAAAVQRYVGIPSMGEIGTHLAGPLAVVSNTAVGTARACARGWRLADEDGCELGEYEALIVATPPEQAQGFVPPGTPLRLALMNTRSLPCWALMLAFAHPLPLDFDAAHISDEAIAWIARDSSKPDRGAGERWVIHASPTYSAARLSSPPTAISEELSAAFFSVLGLAPQRANHGVAHRWRLARAVSDPPCGTLWDADLRLAVCGDWCVAARLEGAYLSGMQAGKQVAKTVAARRRVMPAGD